jgi:predicted P-loop ATPase
MKSKEISALKPTITNRIDAFRRPFRRDTVQEPRRFVIYGSTDKQYALPNDPAGHRRFPIVEIQRVDFSRLEADRAMLWAEASLAYARGEPFSNIDDVSAQVARYVQEDPLVEAFETWVGDVVAGDAHVGLCEYRGDLVLTLTVKEIQAAMGLEGMGSRTWGTHAIKEHMVATGWESTKNGPKRRNGEHVRVCWYRRVK